MLSPLSWPPALCRVARDRIYAQFGHLPARFFPPGRFLSGIHLGLGIACNGGSAYVVYHRNFFDPRVYARLPEQPVAWLRLDEIARFNREVLPRLESPFVLVTPESDWTAPADFPEECAKLVASGLVRRWFANNYDHSRFRDLVTPLPIGPNYAFRYILKKSGDRPSDHYFRIDAPSAARQEARWDSVIAQAQPLAARDLRAFADFALSNSSRSRRYGESRADIAGQLAGNPAVVFPARRLPREDLYAAYTRHAFVISPHGGGLDCYRTWEALLCGCIVIVKRSPLDPLYADLPVVILDDWREISPANLNRWLARFGDSFDRSHCAKILSLDHWRNQIAVAVAALR